MKYDMMRWGFGIVVFIAVFIIMSAITKKKGKAAVTSAFAALVAAAVMLMLPVENFFYSFKSVEQAYNYKHHEELITYVECDEGALCVAQKNDGSFICYTIIKTVDGYKLPQGLNEKIKNRSSKYGIFIFKDFENQSLIMTQVSGCSYDGNKFTDNGNGYYYYVVNGKKFESKLCVNGERVTLV